MSFRLRHRTLIIAFAMLSSAFTPLINAAEVNVYSARIESLIKPLLDTFTQETGIRVNLVTGGADELIQRLQAEGRHTQADLLLTTDVGRLHRAKSAGLTQAVSSELLLERIAPQFRDPEQHWFGLSMRARPILYVRDRVDPSDLDSYEALVDPQWKGRICVRSSSNVYNQSMVASMMAAHGEADTEAWARGLVANFAQPPRGGDRDQIKAAAAGVCDLVLANTYYLVGMLQDSNPAEREAAAKMGVFWPNQTDRGVHINISGAALTAHAKHPEAAVALLEFLSRDASQRWYAEENGEYPIRPEIPLSAILESWGSFQADPLDMQVLGSGNAQALQLMDRAGWR